MDDADPVNYRSISNLNTITKILERLFLHRILLHVSSSSNYNPLQSAYRRGHSTETALLKMADVICTEMDSSRSTIMIVWNMSAVFDTIDHDLLLQRLQITFGIEGTAVNFIRSCIHDPHSYVKSGSGQSAASISDIGVPQGSSLDPLLWSPPLHNMLQLWWRSRSASAYSTISTPMTSTCTSSPAKRSSPRKYRQLNVAQTPYITGCSTTALPLTHRSRTSCSSVSSRLVAPITSPPSTSWTLPYRCLRPSRASVSLWTRTWDLMTTWRLWARLATFTSVHYVAYVHPLRTTLRIWSLVALWDPALTTANLFSLERRKQPLLSCNASKIP